MSANIWKSAAPAGWYLPSVFRSSMSRVEIDIVAKGAGCELTLTHHGVPQQWQAQTTEGWTKLLGNLEREITAR